MEAKIYTLVPQPTARGALLQFTIELKFISGEEVPLSATGYLAAPSEVIICSLMPAQVNGDALLGGSDGYGHPQKPGSCYVTMVAALGRTELDYISDLRSKDAKGDVHLTVSLSVRCLATSSTVTYVEKGRPIAQDGSAFGIVIREHANPAAQALVGERYGGFLKATTVAQEMRHRIPGNDWTHDFAPRFGLGKFLVFEVPQPSIIGTGAVQERVARALDAARTAEDRLREGKWTDACTALRQAWELLRDSSDVRALLLKDGYTTPAAEAFDQATNQLFQFASKFMHAIDKQGNVIAAPDIKANKEEAQLAFAAAMGFINLLAQKAR